MIDVDNSGSLDKAEVVDAIKSNQKVIKFLVNCALPRPAIARRFEEPFLPEH